jgi:hypothetical protein
METKALSTTDYDVTAVTLLNRYLWQELQAKLGWGPVNGVIPFTTASQTPTFDNTDKPYIVYTYTKNPSGRTDFFIKSESVMYRIVSPHESDIRQALNLIEEALNRYDASARDVNKMIDQMSSPIHKRFEFQTVYMFSAEGADPQESEGGRQDGYVSVRATYTESGSEYKYI